MSLFESRSAQEFTQSFIRYLPGGKLFRAKNQTDKVLYKFLNGLAVEAGRVNELLKAYNEQIYPDTTVDFIVEWEKAVSIPDTCFTNTGTLEVRRSQIIAKLVGMSLQTSADFVALALTFGLVVTVVGGKDASVSPVITPDRRARFTIVIKYTAETGFDYEFDFAFGGDAVALLTCMFNKIKPANCQVLFQSI